MEPITIGLISVAIGLVIMFAGIPIPIAMMVGGFVGMAAIMGAKNASLLLASDLVNTFSGYTYTAIPLFGMMGYVAYYSGVGENLFTAANAFIGHKRGGLAMSTEVASAVFGAICGSFTACIGTMCAIAYPEMRKRGYHPSLAAPAIAAGSTLSVLIPPSANYITYGILTESSISKLFMGGIIPGIILTLVYCVTIYIISKRHPDWAPVAPKSSWAERFKCLKNGGLIQVAIVFVLSMGGLFAGFFTPTEAGAAGTFLLLLVTTVTGRMNFKKLIKTIKSSVQLTGMIYFLFGGAAVFGHMFTVTGLSAALNNLVASMDVHRVVILLMVVLIYFILGMFCDMMGVMMVTVPIFYQIICVQLRFDTVLFGTIILLIGCIGGLTPPVGNSVFVCNGCVSWDKEASLSKIFAGVWPFVIATMVMIAIVIAVPELCTFLPGLMYS